MIIVYKPSASATYSFAVGLDVLQGLRCDSTSINGWNGYPTVFASDNQEEINNRFNDLVEAAAADQKVYDVNKDVGYWKEKEKPEEKPKATRGRKPKAEKSESAEHSAPAEHTPAPKK